MRHSTSPLVLLLVLLLTGAVAASAGTVGREGEIYSLETGRLGDLYPGASPATAAHSALALHVLLPDGAESSYLVPTSDDPNTESFPTLVADAWSDTLYILWSSDSLHSTMRLTSFDLATGFSEIVEIAPNSFSYKHSPRLAATRADYLDAEGVLHHRTALHLVWWEEGPDGLPNAYYAIVTIDDASFGSGEHRVFELPALVAANGDGAWEAAPSAGGVVAPVIRRGEDPETVLVGFGDARSGRLAAAEIRLLPAELTVLADTIAERVGDFAAGVAGEPDALEQVIGEIRQQLIDIGARSRFEPSFLDQLFEELARSLEGGQPDLRDLHRPVRQQLIDIGARLSASPLRSLARPIRQQLIDIGARGGIGARQSPTAILDVRLRLDLPLPAIEGSEPSSTRLFLSSDATEALLAWELDGEILFRESIDAAWRDERSLPPGSFDAGHAFEMLERRIANR